MRSRSAIVVSALASLVLTSCRGCTEAPSDAHLYPPANTALRKDVAIECGAADPGATFVSGWFMPEAGRFRWSDGPRSQVDFSFKPTDEPYVLVLEGSGYNGPKAQVLGVRLNGNVVATPSLRGGFERFIFALPHDFLREGRNSLVFDYAWTRAPAQEKNGAGDTRQLAFALHRFAVHRLGERAFIDIVEGRRSMQMGPGWRRDDDENPKNQRRWKSVAEATLRAFVSTPGPSPFELVIDGHAERGPVDVEVLRGDERVGRARLLQEAVTTIPLAEGAIRNGENELRLRYHPVEKRPNEPPPEVQVAHLELRPRSRVDAGP